MPSKAIRFPTAGGHELAARLELPEGEARAASACCASTSPAWG